MHLVAITSFLAGLVVVIAGAELIVRGGSRVGALLGVSPMVLGLTVVAVGTSAPELATTIMATLKNERDIAIGNLIGSSTYNILFILGVTCLATPSRVPVDTSLLHVDLPLAALRWWRCCACPSSSPTGASRAWRALCLSRLTRCTWAR